MSGNLWQTFPQGGLPYIPLPADRFQLIRSVLEYSFSSNAIRTNHEFTAKNDAGRLRVNCVAFTSDTHYDPGTAAITVYYEPSHQVSEDTILSQMIFSGAPFVFIGREDKVFPFGMRVNGKLEPQPLGEPLFYEELGGFLEQYQSDINPDKISAVKRGTSQFIAFPQLNPFQLRLFAFDITRDLLAENFENAINSLRKSFRTDKRDLSTRQENIITEIAVYLLGAIILAHKGRLGVEYQSPEAPFTSVFERASEMFPKYFNQRLVKQHFAAAETAYRFLQQATYSSFTPDILDELYLRAYPSIEKRKREGRFDTPLYLTRLILDNIPIENIRPKDRLLADITCGWGSFLIAGYERLSQIPDMSESQLPLWEHIVGNDSDPFTVQLAELTLLTTSLDDSWQIENQDAFELEFKGRQPTVIVGNPKFWGDRKLGAEATEPDTTTGKAKRWQAADAFLMKAISLLAPGGYLGMLMPQSFSIGEASTAARKMLLEHCDVLELWDLPLTIFGKQASVSPMVIFARKRHEAGMPLDSPVRIRATQGRSLEQAGVFITSNIAPSQAQWGMESIKAKSSKAKVTHLITYTTILSEAKWHEISGRCRKLTDIAEIILGAIVGSKRPWANYPEPKWVSWLSGVKSSMPRPFFINYGSKKVLYPNELERPRKDKEHLLAGSKVLMVADPNPSWGKRAKVAIERRGYYASDSFWILVPKQELLQSISLEVLAAILSWDVSNAWIVENLKYPKIQRRILDTIPIPSLSRPDIVTIEEAIRKVEVAVEREERDEKAERAIDEVFKRTYGLDEHTFQILRMVMEWNSHTVIRRPPAPDPKTTLWVSGQIAGNVDAVSERIDVWFDGIPETHTVPIVDNIPGWMLREGAGFEAEVSYQALLEQDWEKLEWWNIRPKKYTYMTEEELIERLTYELASEKG